MNVRHHVVARAGAIALRISWRPPPVLAALDRVRTFARHARVPRTSGKSGALRSRPGLRRQTPVPVNRLYRRQRLGCIPPSTTRFPDRWRMCADYFQFSRTSGIADLRLVTPLKTGARPMRLLCAPIRPRRHTRSRRKAGEGLGLPAQEPDIVTSSLGSCSRVSQRPFDGGHGRSISVPADQVEQSVAPRICCESSGGDTVRAHRKRLSRAFDQAAPPGWSAMAV